MKFQNNYNPFVESEQETVVVKEGVKQLIVWNDDVNTFDWVIESLQQICDHTAIQAEQCSILIHFKGKCAVKQGSYDYLEPMKEALVDRGLSVTIDK